MEPDLILHDARIATCDPRASVVSAVAVWNDRIGAIGADQEVLSLAGAGTRIVDLRGRFVAPGFIDCHAHLTSWAMIASGRQIDLGATTSLAEALARVERAVPDTPKGAWLRGRGWDKNHWAENRFPTAADLDAVTGDVPAVFPSHDGHSLWANSRAIAMAGIPHDVPDPPGGRVLRDESGTLTGIFQEAAAGLIWDHVPSPTSPELTEALRQALPQASALGLTGIHNCEGGDALGAVQNLRDSGGLSVRVTRYFPAQSLECAAELGIRAGFGDEWIRIAGVKAFLDGALGAQTAAMLQPYADSDNVGVLTMDLEELERLVSRATEAGLAVALHAIGDRAVRMAIDAFAAVRAGANGASSRHRLEHAQHFHPDDIARCAQAGLTLSMQPAHLLADIDTCERHLGGRGRWAFPLRSLLDAGVTLGFGSDAPVETIDPLAGIRSAMARQRHDATPQDGWYPQERISAYEALRAYTTDAAYAGGTEQSQGSLECGKLADLVVLSHDLLTSPLEALGEMSVLATVVGGRTVYDPEGLLA